MLKVPSQPQLCTQPYQHALYLQPLLFPPPSLFQQKPSCLQQCGKDNREKEGMRDCKAERAEGKGWAFSHSADACSLCWGVGLHWFEPRPNATPQYYSRLSSSTSDATQHARLSESHRPRVSRRSIEYRSTGSTCRLIDR